MRIYISGPMTGKPDYNYPAFNAAAKRLREKGHFVINPAELSAIFGTPEEIDESGEAAALLEIDAFPNRLQRFAMGHKATMFRAVMDADLAAVRSCDAIYLLPGWESSRGAKKELAEAIAQGLEIMQQEGDKK